jgi:hypothetical protein
MLATLSSIVNHYFSAPESHKEAQSSNVEKKCEERSWTIEKWLIRMQAFVFAGRRLRANNATSAPVGIGAALVTLGNDHQGNVCTATAKCMQNLQDGRYVIQEPVIATEITDPDLSTSVKLLPLVSAYGDTLWQTQFLLP